MRASAPRHDRGRRDAAGETIDRFACGWLSTTPLPAFLDALDALPGEDTAAVIDVCAALLCQDGWTEALLARISTEMRADPYFEPPFIALQNDVQTGLVLLDDRRVGISLGVAPLDRLAARKLGPRGRTAIAFSGHASVIRVLRGGGARLSFWDAPAPGMDFTGTGRCTFAGEHVLTDGELLRIDGRTRSFVIERASGDVVLLQATIRTGAAPFLVEYDSATLDCIAIGAADEQASRIQMLASLIGALGRRDAGPALAQAAASPHGFVRWHAMREWLALDAAAALPALATMAADDPHPQVRDTARAALALFERREAA